MSLIYADGLDIYGSIAEALQGGWIYENTNMDVLPTGGRFGGGGIGREAINDYWARIIPLFQETETIIVQWAYKTTSDGDLSTHPILEFRDVDNPVFTLNITPEGTPFFSDDSSSTVAIAPRHMSIIDENGTI